MSELKKGDKVRIICTIEQLNACRAVLGYSHVTVNDFNSVCEVAMPHLNNDQRPVMVCGLITSDKHDIMWQIPRDCLELVTQPGGGVSGEITIEADSGWITTYLEGRKSSYIMSNSVAPTVESIKPYTPVIVDNRHWTQLVGYLYMQIRDYKGEWNGARRISPDKFRARVEGVHQSYERILLELKQNEGTTGQYWTPPNQDQVRYYWSKS